ncbi:MAG TPA: hypothetical protein VLH75_12640 [Longimicrobiales bacterium]|nr:hypothetical protein [Longimicrobiales bacterium]
MQILNRLRHAGVLVFMAVALAACQDGFFFDPAPGRVTPVAVHWTLAGATSPGAAGALGGPQGVSGVGGPQASPGAAFDKADSAKVVLRAAEKELFNQRLALESAGSDKKVSFSVELPAGSAVQATLELTLLRGQDALFTGNATAQLTPGQASEVEVPLAAVLTRIEAGGPYVIRTLGSTLRVTAVGLFATGDSAGVTATYRALDANVSVAVDGTVRALTNGSGRVEAAYLGRADTAVVTVEDRCFGPFATLALGQTVNGTLEANDCLDGVNFSYNDWYSVTLTAPTLFRATLTSDGFETFVGANLPPPDRGELSVAANAGTAVVSEHYFPAESFLIRAGSRARPTGPVPTGSYSLALTPASEPQEGCFAGASSSGATWVVEGIQLSGRLAADDCALPNGARQDVYAGRLEAGDTAVVTVEGGFNYRFVYGSDVRSAPPGGGRTHWAFTSDSDQSHYVYLRTDAQGPFGSYMIRFSDTFPPDYDACVNSPIGLGIGPVGSPVVRTGRLQRRIDCESGDRVRDAYRANTPTGPFRTTLESTDFNPFVTATNGSVQTAGRANATGRSVTAEHLYPAGRPYEIRALPAGLVSAGDRVQGSYTLTAVSVSEPQAGCFAGTSQSTFVDVGSVASGRITSEDCRDLFAPDTATVTRWVDGYAILLQPGQTVTVQLTADFPVNFVRWVGNTFTEGHFGVPAGESRTFTVTQPAGSAAFHGFYAISGQDRGTGSYTMTFSGAAPAPPSPVSGAARAEPQVLRLPGGR